MDFYFSFCLLLLLLLSLVDFGRAVILGMLSVSSSRCSHMFLVLRLDDKICTFSDISRNAKVNKSWKHEDQFACPFRDAHTEVYLEMPFTQRQAAHTLPTPQSPLPSLAHARPRRLTSDLAGDSHGRCFTVPLTPYHFPCSSDSSCRILFFVFEECKMYDYQYFFYFVSIISDSYSLQVRCNTHNLNSIDPHVNKLCR